MFKWLAGNWTGLALVFFILYSIASEAIGMSKMKENAVVQVVIRIFGRLSGRVNNKEGSNDVLANL